MFLEKYLNIDQKKSAYCSSISISEPTKVLTILIIKNIIISA